MRALVVTKALWRFLFRVVGRVLPFRAASMLARLIAVFAWWLGGNRKRIAMQNLRMAYPDKGEPERLKLARASFTSLLTVFMEILPLRYLSLRKIRELLVVEGRELFEGIEETGALLLSGHFGNWELLAYGTAVQVKKSFSIIVKKQNDYGELDCTRTAQGNTIVPLHRAAREASQQLAEGGIIAMLADQSAGERDHLVKMFGIETYAFSAPSRLVLRYRPKVIIGFAVRQANGIYKSVLRELPHDDLQDTPEGALIFTQRYASALEEAIRENPEQWVWQHRRWKHSPGVTYG